jgi:RsiW-degrading membrane proteinase PrsW (M82 family)
MWIASVALVAGLVLFVLAVFALAPLFRTGLQGAGLVIAGVVLALVPAAVWLGVFYLQDRVEPEPKRLLMGVFLLGALVANGVGQPLIQSYFRVNEWASSNFFLKLFAGIFIIGIIQEFLKYAAVRYSVYGSQEYDERIDGIIYGAAAGLGYATMLNITYVVGNGGVDLGIGAVRIAVTALAHASFSGVMGYFLGRAKFENRGPLWLPLGLLVSAVLNGIVTAAVGEIARSGLRTTPLNGLVLSAAIAAATFVVLFVIIQRTNRATLAATRAGLSG